MKLKSIIIQGFKSFADKTQIEFEGGITEIVGPNGSGKSNIIEALRWVLGEQSAKNLRGSRMEDIIFSGSKNRSRVNRASVTVTLDNSNRTLKFENDLVEITRSVYRNGESVFLINGKTVRLKDIIALFVDTGIGKESFSIISQGKVEEIFNSKPENRRALVEEVAGILKYKNEKYKSQKELSETTKHLERVSDITTELYSQYEPLKEQSSIAKEYLETKKKYNQFYLSNLVLEIKNKSVAKQKLEKKKQETEKLLVSYEDEGKENLKKRDSLKENQKELELSLASEQKQLMSLKVKKEHLLSEKKLSYQNQQFKEQQKKDISTQISNNFKIISKNLDSLKKIDNEINKVSKEKKVTEKELSVLKQHNNLDIVTKIDELRQLIFDNLKLESKIQNDLALIEIESKGNFLDESLLLNLKNKEEILKNKKLEIKDQVTVFDNQIKQNILESEKLLTLKEKLSRRYDDQRKRWFEGSNILQKSKVQYNALKNISNNYSNYYQGVREVLNSKSLSGIVGSVAEVLEFDSKYSKAFQEALGSHLQSIVTVDDSAAKNAIQYLKSNRLGRATFLPRNTVARRFIDTKIKNLKIDGLIGVASELAKSDKQNEVIKNYLLANILIAKDLDSTSKIARYLKYRFKVVSLDGDIINAGGTMIGGFSREKHLGILEQKQKTKKFRQDILVMQEKLAKLELQGSSLSKELKDVNLKIENNKQNLSDIQIIKTRKLSQIENFDEEIKEKEEEIQKYFTKKDISVKNISHFLDKRVILNKKLKEVQEKKVALNINLKEHEKLQAALQKNRKLIIERNNELNKFNQKLQELQLNNQKANERIIELREENLSLKRKLSSIEITSEKIDYNLEITELNSREEDQKRIIKNLQERQSLFHKELADSEFNTKRISDLQKIALEEQKDLSIALGKVETLLDKWLVELSEEFNITFEEASKKVVETDLDKTKQKLKLLKMTIADLGEVNLGAIEEFKRISERYEFLIQQQDDLLKAKDKLLEGMREIDLEVKERFKTTFEKLENAFSKLFPEIFGGGSAKLILTNPSNLLETGIEIMAQPPGKKLQNLTLLSGGEKALTAITLLFAILKVKSVPFVVLDEAEAALDEANVVRYSKYLREFDKKTQFIVITHRKGTMLEADVLYGVTMQEPGVSKVISVSMDKIVGGEE